MHTSGIEDLKLAIRRSAWLIVALVVLGIVAMNVVKQLDGPQYEATGRVLLSSTDLAASLAGIQSVYVDPERRDDAEGNVANSPPLYTFAASRSGGLGTGGDLEAATSASARNNIVRFVAKRKIPRGRAAIANAVASSYPEWRASITSKAIDTALADLRAAESRRSGSRRRVRRRARRLQLQKTLISSRHAPRQPRDIRVKTTPNLSRDSMLGGAIGLVVALLVAAVREALNTRVRSEGDVEDMLGAPVLATIHALPRGLRHRAGGTRRATRQVRAACGDLAADRRGDGDACIAVTSAVPGEGKTTTATNLAVALALRGQNVVLADFDLRKPPLGGFFRIPKASPGVSELVDGERTHRGCPLGRLR